MEILKKLLKEIENSKNPIEERIHVYLCSLIDVDEEMQKSMAKETKTIQECAKYLYGQGSKIAFGGVADVSPEMEIEWIREYYLKDKIAENEYKILPKGKTKTEYKEGKEIIEKIVEVEKKIEVVREPTFEDIKKYLKEQKKPKPKVIVDDIEELTLL